MAMLTPDLVIAVALKFEDLGLTVVPQALAASNIKALHPTARGRAEQALSRRCRESPSNWTASGVFGVLATAVSSHSEDGASPEISDLLVEYVRKLGDGWTAVGLRPEPAGRNDLQEPFPPV